MSDPGARLVSAAIVANHDVAIGTPRGGEFHLGLRGVDDDLELGDARLLVERLSLCVQVAQCKPVGAIFGGVVAEPEHVGLGRLQCLPIVVSSARDKQLNLGDLLCPGELVC